MPPIGTSDLAPAWGWPDALVGLVLAVCLCVLIVRAAAWLRCRDALPGWARGTDRAPVGLGLFLALVVTLLVRGHPDQQVLVGAVALALTGASSPLLRPRSRRRLPDPVTTSPS